MNHDSIINLSINSELRIKFKSWCNAQGKTMVQVLRDVIRQMVDAPKKIVEV